jgi:membrane fusion protein (multidrug efflux system)
MPRVLLAGLLLLIGVPAAVAYWWFEVHFVESTDNAYVRGDVTAISPGAGGEIVKVWVRENQTVVAGDALISIDAEPYKARLNQARAQLAVADAALKSLDEQLNLQDVMVREAEAGLNAADAEYERAGNEWKRMNSLGDKGYAARQGIENTQAARRSADAGVLKARASVDASRQRKAALKADRERLRAEREAAEAAVNLAELDLAYTEVKAPVAGVVADLMAKRGLRVREGARLLTLVPLEQLWVEANFKETQIERMYPGQAVDVVADAFPGQPLKGSIESLAPASGSEFALLPPENATGNFTKVVQRVPVRIALPAQHALAGRLRPGLSVYVSVDVSASDTKDKARAPVKPSTSASKTAQASQQ